MIADEVMTGFGRTGRWFGVDHWGVRPDIMTAGKGTTAGTCPSASRRRAARSTTRWRPPGSCTGSRGRTTRSGRAAGRAVLGVLRDEDLVARSAAPGARLRDDLRADARRTRPSSGDVRGLGMLIGIELVRDRDTKEPFARTERVHRARRERPRATTGCCSTPRPVTSTASTAT